MLEDILMILLSFHLVIIAKINFKKAVFVSRSVVNLIA